MSFEGEQVFFTNQNLVNPDASINDHNQSHLSMAEAKFMHFIRSVQVDGIFIYREQLKNNALRGQFYLKIDREQLEAFDEQLASNFKNMPGDYLNVFETAVETIYRNDIYDEMNPDLPEAPKFQVQISTNENPLMLRDLQSGLVGKLVCVPAIITQTQKTDIRARKAVWQCKNCGHLKKQQVTTKAQVVSAWLS